MSNTTIKHAIGTFENRSNAEVALQKLRDQGFNMDKVSIITRHEDVDADFSGAEVKSSGEQAKGGAKAGATAGAATGGVLGLIGGLGVL
ncbi:general stress protein, partial [Cyanothece sp. BG0011]|uniref:general stress protein n=1 Tax=Cyanothece sp. BG0011 TaxID=2082950 RepID=UPI0030D8E8F1